MHKQYIWTCFVCLFRVLRPTQKFFTHMETSPLPVKGFFWPTLGINGHREQGGFFSVPHVLWRGAAVYIGHHQGTVTLISVAERLAVELSLPVVRSVVVGIRIYIVQPSACEANTLTDYVNAAVHIHSISCKQRNIHPCFIFAPWQCKIQNYANFSL